MYGRKLPESAQFLGLKASLDGCVPNIRFLFCIFRLVMSEFRYRLKFRGLCDTFFRRLRRRAAWLPPPAVAVASCRDSAALLSIISCFVAKKPSSISPPVRLGAVGLGGLWLVALGRQWTTWWARSTSLAWCAGCALPVSLAPWTRCCSWAPAARWSGCPRRLART